MSTEDTTAQLREQIDTAAIRADDLDWAPRNWPETIRDLCNEVDRLRLENAAYSEKWWEMGQELGRTVVALEKTLERESAAVNSVEAAKATARREAWDEGHDAGYTDGATDTLRGYRDASDDHVNPYAAGGASAQGVAPAELVPADCRSGCESAAHVYGCPNFGVQRSGGQGAQSSGHEYGDPEPMLTFTAEQMAEWDRQRDPGQPGEQGPADHPAHVQRDPGQP